jgi:hypothetical protein
MSSFRPLAALGGSLALAATLGVAAPAPRAAPPQGSPIQSTVPTGQVIDGMSCDSQEGSRIHIHQHLTILDRGKPVNVPPNVGQPAGRRCIYWVHTHTPDGVIHIEAPKDRSFTLGNFFDVWGEPLTKTQASSARAAKGKVLKVWVNGKAYSGDPRAIKLVAHTDVVIEAGPPFPTPPRFTSWGPL